MATVFLLLGFVPGTVAFSNDFGHTQVYYSSEELLVEWLGSVSPPKTAGVDPSEAFGNFRRAVIKRLKELAKENLKQADFDFQAYMAAEEYPFFKWIPPYVTSLIPNGPAQTWSNKCFASNTARAYSVANKSIIIELSTAQPQSLLCGDFYLFANMHATAFGDYTKKGIYTFVMNTVNMSTSELFDMNTLGIRVFQFPENREKTWASVLATVNLFVSEATKDVPAEVEKVNLEFMAKYRGVTMEPRTIQEVIINASDIHSGDFLGVIRLDGLDPMLSWAMGGTTGHTTVALWIGGQLYVTESTTKDTYWPTNGVQKTPYSTWVQQAKEAGFQVVHAPLKPEFRAVFNATRALEFFNSVEGVDYGYYNLLWGWVDTLKDNYPCIPPDYTQCLQFEHIPVLFGNLAKVAGPVVGNLLVTQAFAHRVGTQPTSLADVMMVAQQKKLDLRSVPAIPEQDDWVYNTTRFGQPVLAKSMVCCVYVCNIWKAAGLFDKINKEVNCGEFTNWDDYALTIFEENSELRSPVCKQADPNNPTCQLEGRYTLVLNDYHTKDMYPHMAEHCPSLPPKYDRTPGC